MINENTCEMCGKKNGDNGLEGPVTVYKFCGKTLCTDCRDALSYSLESD
jgi:hypothetical protein